VEPVSSCPTNISPKIIDRPLARENDAIIYTYFVGWRSKAQGMWECL
jgi:hypothetical protein